jgi:hypothetical protein
MDGDHRGHSLTCTSRSYGLRRTEAEDIVDRVTAAHAACQATAARVARRAMEVRTVPPAAEEGMRQAVEVADTLAAVVAVGTAQVAAEAATEAGDTARAHELQ